MDGSGPYLILDAIYEFLNFELGDPEQVVDDDETPDDIEEWARTFAKRVLARCWAGTAEFPQKGFRHLGEPQKAGVNPKANPTAIYATCTAIETFLLSVLPSDVHPMAKAKTDEVEVGDGTSPLGEGQTRPTEDERMIDNTIVLAGELVEKLTFELENAVNVVSGEEIEELTIELEKRFEE